MYMKVTIKANNKENKAKSKISPYFGFTTTMTLFIGVSDVDRLLTKVLEDTAYWYHHAEIVSMLTDNYIEKQVARGGVVRFYLHNGTHRDLTIRALVHGLRIWFKKEPDYSVIYNGNVVDVLAIGKEDADRILQYSLFGKVLFK